MHDRDRDDHAQTRPTPKPDHANDSTKPSGQDVGPPGERVDDEADGGDGKTTQRQE